MNRIILSIARHVGLDILRLVALCFGAWLVALWPVSTWADHRRALNAAAGVVPNMDPGTVVFLSAVLAVVPLCAVLLVELVRAVGPGSRPLALPSWVMLGALASWPMGWNFSVAHGEFGKAALAVESSSSVLAFYVVRWAWNSRRGRRQYPSSDARA